MTENRINTAQRSRKPSPKIERAERIGIAQRSAATRNPHQACPHPIPHLTFRDRYQFAADAIAGVIGALRADIRLSRLSRLQLDVLFGDIEREIALALPEIPPGGASPANATQEIAL